jgi:hypothetical protein
VLSAAGQNCRKDGAAGTSGSDHIARSGEVTMITIEAPRPMARAEQDVDGRLDTPDRVPNTVCDTGNPEHRECYDGPPITDWNRADARSGLTNVAPDHHNNPYQRSQ